MSDNILTSPIGSMVFFAGENPVKQSKSDDKMVYTIKIAFDNKKDAEFLSQVAEINDAKVVTERTYRGKDETIKALLATGKSLVGANSKFKPQIFDKEGNELEEAPMFFSDSIGTAQMYVEPYMGPKGGTINLIGVKIHNIEGGTEDKVDRESNLTRLRALVKQK